jgi:hypothetical protein
MCLNGHFGDKPQMFGWAVNFFRVKLGMLMEHTHITVFHMMSICMTMFMNLCILFTVYINFYIFTTY